MRFVTRKLSPFSNYSMSFTALHVARHRRVDPDGAEDGHLFRRVRLEQLRHGLSGEKLLVFLGVSLT